jgi:hypothetical protein
MHGRIVWQDVPSAVARANRVDKSPEARKFSRDPENEFFLPTGYVGRGKALHPSRRRRRRRSSRRSRRPAARTCGRRMSRALPRSSRRRHPAAEALPVAVIRSLVEDGHIS